MKKCFCLILAILLVFLGGCTAQKESILLAGGSEESKYHDIANVLKACAFSLWDGGEVIVKSGEIDASRMEAEKVQLAIVPADYLREDAGGITWAATLCYNSVHFVARKDISSLADLAGRRIYVSAENSKAARYTAEILGSIGLSPADWTPVYRDFVDWELNDSDAESVAVCVAVAPYTPLCVYAEDHPLHFVVPTKEEIKAVEDAIPYLKEHSVPAATYERQGGAVDGLAVPVALAADQSLSDKTVEKLTRLMYENRDLIAAACPQMREFDRQDMQADALLPLHTGAKRFYQSIS